MEANKKVDLENVQCPSESKILMNIITNHPLRFSIAASASVPWIYMAQFWHTLREDGSKYRLKFMLDRKELTFTLDDFRTIFHLPQANDNNHASRARDAYHNLQDDDIMKNIFNSGRNKNKVGMRIPPWMITEEMKLTEHYKMYAEVFGLDVPLIQSQPTKSTQGMYRTTSAPRSPNPATEPTESKKADEMILQNTIQVSLAKHKSREEQEARENVALVDEHLAAEEIEKLEKDEETSKDTEVEPNIVIPVNVDDEKDEITDEVFELRRRAKGKNVEESRISPIPSPTRSPRHISTLVSLDTEKLQELTVTHPTPSSGSFAPKLTKTNRLLSLIKAKPNRFKRYKTFFHELQGRYGYLFVHLKKRFMPRASSDQLANNLHDVMMETLPSLVGERESNGAIDASVRSYMSGHILHVHPAQVQSFSVPEQQHQLYLAMKADPLLQQQDITFWLALQMKFEKTQGENSTKRQKTSEYEAYVSGESLSRQDNVEEPGPTLGNQEQDDEFDFWTDSYASDDDEIPTKQVTQDIMEEISLTIDEAKLKKMADEMLRQRCTSGDEHQYHIDQMKNFLQSDIVLESRKEILVSLHPQKITPLVQSCQRDPEAPALSLINQDLLYLKKGNSGPKKIVLSLHKFPAIVFNDDDIEERTSRWVNKYIKKFNPYARFGVENWKNPHAKIFYIRRQKEPGRPNEEIYSNSKIIVERRANDCIVSIIEPDYKNLNKNDIEDMYLLIVNNKVPDYANTGLLWSLSVLIRSSVIWERVHDFQLGIESYQPKINLTTPTITFPGIEEYDVFSIVYEPVHGIIYTNSKKEKRVMRPSEIHKFCDATLRRMLEGDYLLTYLPRSYYSLVIASGPKVVFVTSAIPVDRDHTSSLVEELAIKVAEEVAEEDNRNANLGNGRNGCSYKEFVACNPKEFDGKGGAIAYIRWVEKMEAVQDISGKDKGRIILNSLENGALVWPIVALENGTVRPKTYEELSNKEKLQANCDLKATNIVLRGTSLSKQEHECKLYDEFDKFSYVKGETVPHLPPEWGKFATDVKLARDLHTLNYDQLYAYLEQHEFPQIDSGLAVPTFLLGDDLIACMNKSMAFLSAVFTPRYPSTNNQLKSSSNLRNQATVQDGRVTVQQVQGRQGEGHMARQCTQPKRRRDATWFKEKVLLVQAQAEGKILDEEQLAFLAVPRVVDGQVAQTITHNVAFQTDDLDAYASDCDDISSAKAVLMANLSSCDSDVLSEITSDSNIIPYSQYLEEMQQDKANNESKIVNESLTAELERYKERVKNFKQRFKVDLSSLEKFIDSQMDDVIPMKNTKFAAIETEIDTLKQTLSKHVKEKESLLTTLNGFKMEFKERESKSIDKEIVLENKNKELENIVYFGKRFVPQQELSTEQMFWLQSSNKNSKEPSTSNTPVKIKVPSELPKFDKGLYDEITKAQTIFTQMEAAVEQCSVDR
ncbi:hypothetical protein Tco_0756002 [Tanacetum coccineum]